MVDLRHGIRTQFPGFEDASLATSTDPLLKGNEAARLVIQLLHHAPS